MVCQQVLRWQAIRLILANESLLLLGANTITSFADDDSNAVLVNRFYGSERDALLRSHRWNFAISTANLASLADTPIIDWQFKFTLPTDPYCLRILDVRTVTGDITYVQRVEDPTQFDALFYQALVFRLAWKMAYPVTRSSATMSLMGQMYDAVVRDARTVDSQEGTPEIIATDTLTDVRLR